METAKIPLQDLSREIDELWPDLTRAIEGVLRSAQFILGPSVRELEREVASFLGVSFAIGVNSGTDAITIGLESMGVGHGDEVITSPFTFFATAESIHRAGATPVFVDIDPKTFSLDVGQVKARITSRTKAIIPVHLFGHAADMEALRLVSETRGVPLLEDCAQAFGAKFGKELVGTIGRVAAISFFPSKNLGCFGDGGMVVTNDQAVAERARMLRAHGSRQKYFNETIGYNSRLDEIQAAVLRVKLPRLARQNELRREAAARYASKLADIEGIVLPSETAPARHVYNSYTIRVKGGRRDEVAKLLAEEGIGTMVYYPTPLHRLPLYNRPEGTHPHAELAAAEVLSIPLWPGIGEKVQDRVAEALARAMRVETSARRA